jgi:cholest-4-en-3-one 26-monooxygenase
VVDFADINLLDRDVFTRGIPHEWFTFLRKNAPVWFHPEPGDGRGFWVITKHDDVTAIGKDGILFSSDQSNGGVVMIEDPPEEERKRMEEMSAAAGKLMLMIDPPEHTRYRKLVNRGFTPRMIKLLEPHLREMSVNILEPAIARGDADFVVDVAAELPLQAIAELIGVPQEDRHKIFDWSNRMIGSEDPEYAVSADHLMEAQIEMFMYAQALGEERRKEPRDDIISALLAADIDGDALSAADFNMFFLLLAVAGNETTRNAISHGMNALLDHPDQYAELVADPSLVPSAVEEILRWASPVLYFRRNATADTEIRGQKIKAGDKLTIWYISANRDEDVFENPFEFDIHRSPNPHIAFGGGGPHHCLGSNLARMEITLLFEELVKRVPRVERLGEADRLRSNFIGGIKHLPVRFHAEATAGV